MKKILFFDWWEKGAHQFLPLYRHLAGLGHECLLVHYGRWYDPEMALEQDIQGLLCREIAFYGGRFTRALDAEKPDAVLGLNIGATIDRVVHRACRSREIPSIYLMHGVKAVGAYLEEGIRYQNARWSLARRISKIPKYAGIVFEYLATIAEDRPSELFSPATYAHFFQLVSDPAGTRERPWPHKDVYSDLALVYANAYGDSLIREAHFPRERVVVVGNPNLDAAVGLAKDPAGQAKAAENLAALGVAADRKTVVYMEDAFVEQGLGGWTDATRLEELRLIAQCTESAGLDLIVKLHPGSNPSSIIQDFADSSTVHVVREADNAELVWASVATIGHVSTTLFLPTVLDRPLVVPTWSPGLEDFGCFFIDAGVAIPARTPEDLTNILLDLEKARASVALSLSDFLRDYVTHIDGGTWPRVAAEILRSAGTNGAP